MQAYYHLTNEDMVYSLYDNGVRIIIK